MNSRPTLRGFAEPYTFEYPALALSVGAVVLLVASVIGAAGLVALVRGGDLVVVIGPSVFVAALVTIVFHEVVHAIVARILGYRVTFGVGRIGRLVPVAYAATFEQVVSRRDNALVAVAPLIVITVLAVPALAVVPVTLVPAVIAALVTNTSGAVGDVYAVWRLARLPAGSVCYDASLEEMLIYEPTPIRG